MYKNDPKGLMELISQRRSMGLSRYREEPVDRHLVEMLLEAANWAPSHGDTEPWRFSVFMGEGRERLAEVFELAERDPSASGARKRAFAAPVWIAIGVVPKTDDEGKLVMDADEEMMAVACAVQNLHLMATSLGLAGMWHSKGLSTDPNVEKALGLPAPAKLLGFFMCGWPASDTPVGERGPWQDKVVWHEQASPQG